MKRLIMLNGTMGVGKTATSNELNSILERSVFLDGDWCWNMNPFVVTEETKGMVIDNITHTLNNFIKCDEFENIIFCWVIHKESIFEDVLSRVDTINCDVYKITLICDEESLRARLQKDIDESIREEEIIARSIERIELYQNMNTIKLDVSRICADESAQRIKEIVEGNIDADN